MYGAREKSRLDDENKNVRVPVKYNIMYIINRDGAAVLLEGCNCLQFFFNKSLSAISFDFQ